MNRDKTFYPADIRLNKPSETLILHPVKDSVDLKMGNCFQLPYISGSYLPISLTKKDNMQVLKIYTNDCAKSNKGNLNKTYKKVKLRRLYSVSKGQERVNG